MAIGVSRRRIAAAVLLAVLAACANSPGAPTTPAGSVSATAGRTPSEATTSPAAAPSASGAPSCGQAAAALPVEKQAALLFMVAVEPGTSPQLVAGFGVGSVLLLGDWSGGQAATVAQVDAMTRAVPGLLVATDQEGGVVQRLRGKGIDTIPNAVAQAAMGDAALADASAGWAAQLWGAGVRYNLAPVADVVPVQKVATNQPIGVLKRGYGSDPAVVASRVAAFVSGMQSIPVATSLKHFPGLGEVTGNTDFTTATDTVTTRGSTSIEPFRAGIRAGASSVMVSSAVYSKIDPGVPAVFSTVIVTDMLRGDLGFTGVVVSDDLGSAKSVEGVAPADRAVRFVAAGGDLLINADPELQPAMSQAVLKRANSDAAFARQVAVAAGRVLALKSSVGIGTCRP